MILMCRLGLGICPNSGHTEAQRRMGPAPEPTASSGPLWKLPWPLPNRARGQTFGLLTCLSLGEGQGLQICESLVVSEQKTPPASGFSVSGLWLEETANCAQRHSVADLGPAPPSRTPPQPTQSLMAFDPLAGGVPAPLSEGGRASGLRAPS